MVALAALYVSRYALPIPYADEWSMVDAATGRQGISWRWLWAAHNEHRMPLPKLAYLALGKLTQFHFSSMALGNLAILSIASAALLAAIRQMRGRHVIGDCLIPALVLHCGHQINLTWDFQINYCLCAGLVFLFLAAICVGESQWRTKAFALQVGCLQLLPMCGTFGVVYVPCLAAWLFYQGICECRADRRGPGTLALAGAIAAIISASAYLFLLPSFTGGYVSHNPVAVALGSAHLLTTSIGPLGRGAYPVSTLALLAALGGAVWLAMRRLRRRSIDTPHLLGILAVLTGSALLAIAMAYGRAGHGVATTLQTRYGILLVPLPICLYLLFDRCGTFSLLPPGKGRRVSDDPSVPAKMTMPVRDRSAIALVVIVALVAINDHKGIRDGKSRRLWMDEVVRAARSDQLNASVCETYAARLQARPAELEGYFAVLRMAGLPPFDRPLRR